jgi:hypothetical protein
MAKQGALYDAWAAAYWQLAHIFIDREKVLYAQAGWVGWKPFVLQKRIKESDEISSFYLVPKEEGLPLSTYRPGQFISIRVFVKELGLYQCRQCVLLLRYLPRCHPQEQLRFPQLLALRRALAGPLPHLCQARARRPRHSRDVLRRHARHDG